MIDRLEETIPRHAMSADVLQKIAWHYVRFLVPREWEVTHYTVSGAKGRLSFGTRHGHQGLFSWQRCKATPDLQRTTEEFYRRQTGEGNSEPQRGLLKLKESSEGPFRLAYLLEGEPVQASWYLTDEKVLLQSVFPHYAPDALRHVVRPLLRSFALNTGISRNWCLFGIDATLPATLEPEDVSALPAAVSLSFASSRKLKVAIHRWGLPSELLAGQDLVTVYRRLLNRRGYRTGEATETTIRGVDAVLLDVRQRGEFRMDRLTGRWWRGQACVWHDAREKRIYACEQIGPPKVDLLDLHHVFAP